LNIICTNGRCFLDFNFTYSTIKCRFNCALGADQLEKPTIWKLLNVEQEIGVSLRESMAMWPASSVSGYYFANSQSKYFGLEKIN
jgi:cobalamin-dependent methionine synthase I